MDFQMLVQAYVERDDAMNWTDAQYVASRLPADDLAIVVRSIPRRDCAEILAEIDAPVLAELVAQYWTGGNAVTLAREAFGELIVSAREYAATIFADAVYDAIQESDPWDYDTEVATDVARMAL